MKLKLTDTHVRKLKAPDDGRIEVSDTERKGLRLRITPGHDKAPGGRKVWMYEKRVKGGKKRKHTLGAWPATSLAEARAIALEIEAESAKGIDRTELKRARKLEEESAKAKRLTVRQVLSVYDELHLSQLRTGAERKRQIVVALAERLDLPISELEHTHLQEAVDEKLRAGRHVFANRIRAALAAFAKWAWIRGYISEHIGLRVARPTKEQARERVLSVAEVQEVYQAAAQLSGPWTPLVRLLILTGQRRGEITNLRWAEVDLDARRIIKPGSTTKNGKPHVTHLSDSALAVFEGLSAECGEFVFTTTGRKPVSGLSRVKSRLDGLLPDGFEPWRFHDLRTAMATALAKAGEPEAVVDRILNHSAVGSAPSAVARVYIQTDQLPQRASALDRWAEIVTGSGAEVVRLAR